MTRKFSDSFEFIAYKQALAHWSAKDKFMQASLKKLLDDTYQYGCSPDFRQCVTEVLDACKKPADFFLTEKEWRA